VPVVQTVGRFNSQVSSAPTTQSMFGRLRSVLIDECGQMRKIRKIVPETIQMSLRNVVTHLTAEMRGSNYQNVLGNCENLTSDFGTTL
jgi:hypothetical protein